MIAELMNAVMDQASNLVNIGLTVWILLKVLKIDTRVTKVETHQNSIDKAVNNVGQGEKGIRDTVAEINTDIAYIKGQLSNRTENT